MNTNMTGFRFFQKSLHPCALDESSLSIGRVYMFLEQTQALYNVYCKYHSIEIYINLHLLMQEALLDETGETDKIASQWKEPSGSDD